MTGFLRQSVRLVGGRADGRTIEVLTTQTIATVVVSETPHTDPPGVMSPPDGPPVTVTRVEVETYRRDGDSTDFRPYWTQTAIGDMAADFARKDV